MLILMTTANFPDVMLPAYQTSYWCTFYFISFLFIGLYFLLNLLLASIFNKFKERLTKRGINYETKLRDYLSEYIDGFDDGLKGYLDAEEL